MTIDWERAYSEHNNQSIILPLKWNPFAVRRVHDLLHCERCGECCKYGRVPVTQVDVDRAPEIAPYIQREGERGFLITKGGCPFLKDNLCSIYDRRPDVCWLFPMQTPITTDGREMIVLRLKCRSALSAAQVLYSEAKCQTVPSAPDSN